METASYVKKKRFWEKKNFYPTLVGLFIITIMVSSALGLWTQTEDQGTYKYKSIKFAQTEYGWIGYNGDQKITLASDPSELENMTINHIPVYTLNQLSKVYISLDYNEKTYSAIQEFENNIKISTVTRPACISDSSTRCANLPIKTCKDATQDTGVIMLIESNQTEVNLINNCLTIQGPEPTKLVDKIILDQI